MFAAGFVVNLADEVGEDLGVGLRTEPVPGFHERRAEGLVVFDDPVVDEREPAGLVEMRVGVGVVGLAVRGPARVADADRGQGASFSFNKSASAWMRPLHLRVSIWPPIDGGQPGGIVAAVFEPAQAVEEDGSRRWTCRCSRRCRT